MTSDHFCMCRRNFCRAGLHHQDMKAKLTFLLVPALAAALQFAPALLAQPPADKPARQFQMERRARWASLNEEERSKLKAAHQKAMADPRSGRRATSSDKLGGNSAKSCDPPS